MGNSDFYIDFNIETPDISPEFKREAEQQLRELAAAHSDLIGAAVSLERIVKTETPYLYQVRIVVYKRPQNIAVIKKDADPMLTLHDALNTLEENVRVSRKKLAETESHHAEEIETVTRELSSEEVYATYAKGENPEELLQKGRTEIASTLIVEHGLNQEAAYSAADKILEAAGQRTSVEE